jgi:ribosome maturation factor RimP
LPRHWRKNVGRLVKITPYEGDPFTSRITSATDESVTLESKEIRFSNVKRAVVEIEFNRKDPR